MSVKLNFEGMSELRTALQNLPDDLQAEAEGIVTATAQEAKASIQSGYAIGPTGNLHSHVTVTNNSARRAAAVSIVKSTSPHAWIYDNGTKVRTTHKGAGRGQMPARPIQDRMIAKVIRLRARMEKQLVELVRRSGLFEVSE